MALKISCLHRISLYEHYEMGKFTVTKWSAFAVCVSITSLNDE